MELKSPECSISFSALKPYLMHGMFLVSMLLKKFAFSANSFQSSKNRMAEKFVWWLILPWMQFFSFSRLTISLSLVKILVPF